MPMMSGFTGGRRQGSIAGDDAMAALQIEADALSRYCIDERMWDVGCERWAFPVSTRESGARSACSNQVNNSQEAVSQDFRPPAVALRSGILKPAFHHSPSANLR
jgi:hypothetical protein